VFFRVFPWQNLEIAKKMLESCMDIATIAAMTDLSPSEITG